MGEEVASGIYVGDCVEVMKKFPDESFDLLYTDPPFGIDYVSSHYANGNPFGEIKGDKTVPPIDWLKEGFRLLKPDRCAFIYTRWDVYPEWFGIVRNAGFSVSNVIVWNKNNHTAGDLQGNLAFKHEFCIFAVKGKPKLFGKRDVNVWDVARVPALSMAHPTEKPVELAQRAISISTDQGWRILDPFCGVGGSCVAAADLHREYVGIEIEERYAKVAMDRVKFASAQMRLF